MKKIIVAFLLVFIIPSGLEFLFSQQNINSLYSTNGNIVWAVGNGGIVYRSGDGAQSFQVRSFGTSDYKCITGVSALNLWIASSDGNIYLSSNAGSNFIPRPVNLSDNLTSVSFADISAGWVSTSAGKIYRTNDGGLTWSLQNSGTASYINKIKFINALTGFASGKNGLLIKTTNSGNNWQSVPIPIMSDIIAFDFSGNLAAAGSIDGNYAVSTNQGLTWSLKTLKGNIKPDIYCVSVVNDSSIFISGEGGLIVKSTNRGNTITYQNNPSWSDMKSVFFYNTNTGFYASDQNNIILRTINSGTNWFIPNGTSISLSWVQKIPLSFYTSSGNVFYQSKWNKKEIFVTKANTVYRSMDVGETWQPIGSPMPYGAISNSLFVSPKDTNIILAAIDSIDNIHGKVLRSTNYGQTWQITFSANRSSDGIPMAMDPNHPDTIYYGPTDSVMFRSTNFGLTWSQLGNFRFENNCSIKVLNNASNVILVGWAHSVQNGTAYISRSTDYGQSWIHVDSNRGPYPEVPAIAGSELDSVLYATMYQGNEGGLKRSTDNGRNWQYINIDYTAWGFDRSGNDPNVILYAPWDYNSSYPGYISYDKGVHFSPLPTLPVINNFSVYFYNRNNILLQQSVGFYKLKTDIVVPIGIQPITSEIPQNFSLLQNYPNPFNPATKIKFMLPKQQNAMLEIFDALGRKIDVPVNEFLSAGVYEINWDAVNFSSGVYFYKLTAGDFSETRKMVVLK